MKWLIVLFIFLSGVGTYQTSKIKYELPEVKYESIGKIVMIEYGRVGQCGEPR